MATDRGNDLQAFKHFIDEKLSGGGGNLTVDEILSLWDIETQAPTEREETVQALREALDDMRSGDIGIPARQFLAEARRKYDLPEQT
jgi:hypothetical protein